MIPVGPDGEEGKENQEDCWGSLLGAEHFAGCRMFAKCNVGS